MVEVTQMFLQYTWMLNLKPPTDSKCVLS